MAATWRRCSEEMKMSWPEEVRLLMFGFRWWLVFSFHARGMFVSSCSCVCVFGFDVSASFYVMWVKVGHGVVPWKEGMKFNAYCCFLICF